MAKTYQWTNYEQNLLLSAYFCGYVGPNLIAGVVAERFGGRFLIFTVFFLSSIITVLSPFTASRNINHLFCARFLLGICGGFFFSTCHNLISRWAPPEEKGIFVSSLLGSKLGTAVTWPLMGVIIENFGWQSAFYLTSVFSLACAAIWLKIVADSPDKHPSIASDEKEFIERSLSSLLTKNKKLLPMKKIFSSVPFYALLFLHFSDVWGIFFLLTSAPMFMNQALNYDIKNAGIASALPYIARLIFGFLFGALGDYFMKNGVRPTKLRKLFCVFSHIIPGLLLFGFCFVGQNPYVCIMLMTLSLGFNGASTMTSAQNPQDLAPNFAATIFGFVNFFATMSGFISPLVVSYFTQEKNTINEWRMVFILDGVLYITSAIIFILFGSAEVQRWNKQGNYHKELMSA
ncbi:CLUMA_CG020970, isoform A [Clunio marinus]|uniref:CLUMA_CG020970, isoform A n=1 Tax=Clunio marinus TaxID=568069 RepID=A0A1J1J8S2_9DIPT|nr:CLUMA_CG020970, isoform A [Clunio marinus]